jgi:NTE family protein
MRTTTESPVAKAGDDPAPAIPNPNPVPGRFRLAALARLWRVAPERRARRLNLALQGGGAHGAFTWGVLDRLLDEKNLDIAAIAGASAGAINAVLVAAGFAEDGRARAKAKLEAFWTALAHLPGTVLASKAGYAGGELAAQMSPTALIDLTARVLSPYQTNPFGLNPLGDLLASLVDFERLRRAPLPLYVAATEVATGNGRLFTTAEITLNVVLASASLPHLHHAVEIDGRHYWDGGYSANPPLVALAAGGHAGDTLLVQLMPIGRERLPTRAGEIAEHVNNIVFAAPLRREIERIAAARRRWDWRVLPFGAAARLARHRFHRIDATKELRGTTVGSRLIADGRTLAKLRDRGRAAADAWLICHDADIGRTATVDLAAEVLGRD